MTILLRFANADTREPPGAFSKLSAARRTRKAAMPEPEQRQFGDFEILRELGRGGGDRIELPCGPWC